LVDPIPREITDEGFKTIMRVLQKREDKIMITFDRIKTSLTDNYRLCHSDYMNRHFFKILLVVSLFHIAPGFCGQNLSPFTIIPANSLANPKTPGRDYFLAKHRLRLDLSFKVTAREKLDEAMDPVNGVGPWFQSEAEAELSDITLSSVRERDYEHHYFMAFGQVYGFFRLQKYTATFSDDGFLSGADFSFEDQTLSILSDLAKAGVALAALANPSPDQTQLNEQKRKAQEALRLKGYIASVESELAKRQEALKSGITAGNLTAAQIKDFTDAISLLRSELAAAKTARSSLAATGEKSDVFKLTIFPAEVTKDNWVQDATGIWKTITLNPTTGPLWEDFEIKVRKTFGVFGNVAIRAVQSKLPAEIKLILEGDRYAPPVEPKIFGANDNTPFAGVAYRRPRAASAIVLALDENDNTKRTILHRTDGAILKFGQLGQVCALPVKAKLFLKGDMTFSLNADGDLIKMGSGSSSTLGSAMSTAASNAIQNYQTVRKNQVGGGFETELLNAENAKLKAQIDNIKNRKDLHDLQNP
jgi:hypothetical protein